MALNENLMSMLISGNGRLSDSPKNRECPGYGLSGFVLQVYENEHIQSFIKSPEFLKHPDSKLFVIVGTINVPYMKNVLGC